MVTAWNSPWNTAARQNDLEILKLFLLISQDHWLLIAHSWVLKKETLLIGLCGGPYKIMQESERLMKGKDLHPCSARRVTNAITSLWGCSSQTVDSDFNKTKQIWSSCTDFLPKNIWKFFLLELETLFQWWGEFFLSRIR